MRMRRKYIIEKLRNFFNKLKFSNGQRLFDTPLTNKITLTLGSYYFY